MNKERLENILTIITGTVIFLGAVSLGTMSVFGSQETKKQISDAFKSATVYNHYSEQMDMQSLKYLKESYGIVKK